MKQRGRRRGGGRLPPRERLFHMTTIELVDKLARINPQWVAEYAAPLAPYVEVPKLCVELLRGKTKCSFPRCTFAHSQNELVCMWQQVLMRVREKFFCGKCLIAVRQSGATVDKRCIKIYPDPMQLAFFHCSACGGPGIDAAADDDEFDVEANELLLRLSGGAKDDEADDEDGDDAAAAEIVEPRAQAATGEKEGTGSPAARSKKVGRGRQHDEGLGTETFDANALYKCASLSVWRNEQRNTVRKNVFHVIV